MNQENFQNNSQFQAIEGFLNASGIITQTLDKEGHAYRKFNIPNHTQRMANIETQINNFSTFNSSHEDQLKGVSEQIESLATDVETLKYSMRELNYIRNKQDELENEFASLNQIVLNLKSDFAKTKTQDNKAIKDLKLQLSTTSLRSKANIQAEAQELISKLESDLRKLKATQTEELKDLKANVSKMSIKMNKVEDTTQKCFKTCEENFTNYSTIIDQSNQAA